MFTLPVFLFAWAIRFLFSNSSSYLIKRIVLLPLFIAFFQYFYPLIPRLTTGLLSMVLGEYSVILFLKKLLIYQPIEINQWLRLIAAVCLTFSIFFLFFLVAGFKKQEASKLIRNRFKHFIILLAGLFKVGWFCVKIIYQSDKESFKNANYENDTVALSDTEKKIKAIVVQNKVFQPLRKMKKLL